MAWYALARMFSYFHVYSNFDSSNIRMLVVVLAGVVGRGTSVGVQWFLHVEMLCIWIQIMSHLNSTTKPESSLSALLSLQTALFRPPQAIRRSRRSLPVNQPEERLLIIPIRGTTSNNLLIILDIVTRNSNPGKIKWNWQEPYSLLKLGTQTPSRTIISKVPSSIIRTRQPYYSTSLLPQHSRTTIPWLQTCHIIASSQILSPCLTSWYHEAQQVHGHQKAPMYVHFYWYLGAK